MFGLPKLLKGHHIARMFCKPSLEMVGIVEAGDVPKCVDGRLSGAVGLGGGPRRGLPAG